MGNKVKYNLKNVHAAKLTETDSDGTTTFSYAEPKAIPGAVSISLDAEGETSPFYADGIVYFRSVTNNGYSGDLEIALIQEWFRTENLQEKLDAPYVMCCITVLPPVRLSNRRRRKIRLTRGRRLCRLRLIHVPMGWSRLVLVTRQTPVLIRIGIKQCTRRLKKKQVERMKAYD